VSADRRANNDRDIPMQKSCRCWLLLFLWTLSTRCFATDAQNSANPNASSQAKAVLKYFQSLNAQSEKHLISGQFDNYGDWASLDLMDRIHDKTGHYPALLGVDYQGRGGIVTAAPNKAAIDYWRQGGLVTVSTHLYDPENLGGGGLRDRDVDLNALLDENSESHTRWLQELDRVAEGLQQLKDAGVVVLWRPFHEMNGNWFWWNGKDPESFIKLWRQMFDYFSKTKKLDNLLWVYSPNHGEKTTDYYPGDRYVDLIGLDAYTDFVDPEHIKGYAEITRLPKPFGFTEFGPHGASNPPGNYDYVQFAEGIQKNFPRAVFFMCWNAKWSMAQNNNTKELLSRLEIINRDDLPHELTGSQ
jgi:mannan endo-1,4-beta-mannosidase